MTTSNRIVPFGILAMLLFTLTSCLSENPPPSCDDSETEEPILSMAQGAEPDTCDPPAPPEPCDDCPGLHGDPHLRTFDDRRYDVQAAGEMTLVLADDLEVQVRMEPVGTQVSAATAVAVLVDGSRFMVTLDRTSAVGYLAPTRRSHRGTLTGVLRSRRRRSSGTHR